MISIYHASALVKKESMSPTSEAKREVSQNKFMEESDMPDRVESFREVNSNKNRPRARLGLLNSSEMD